MYTSTFKSHVIFCATLVEALPLITLFNLQKQETLLKSYSNGTIDLIITGIGANNMAYAVGLCQNKGILNNNTHWINFGVAGHKNAPIGQIYNVDKILDKLSNRVWKLSRSSMLPNQPLTTVQKQETKYLDEGLFDMEAAGFVPFILKTSEPKQVHVIKIVSDNRNTPQEDLCVDYFRALISEHSDSIQRVFYQLDYINEEQI